MSVSTDEEASEVEVPAATPRMRFYNRVLNLLLAGFAALVVVSSAKSAYDVANDGEYSGFEQVARVVAELGDILFWLFVMVLFVIRTDPVAKARGLAPRITAIAGSFIITLVLLFGENHSNLGVVIVGLLLVASGTIGAAYALTYLGRSFSIMAEARRLVTGGPYRIVRHPVYVTEQIAVLGIVIGHLSWWSVALFFVHVALQVKRALNEEHVLSHTFPEYGDYAARTPRFIPGVH